MAAHLPLKKLYVNSHFKTVESASNSDCAIQLRPARCDDCRDDRKNSGDLPAWRSELTVANKDDCAGTQTEDDL